MKLITRGTINPDIVLSFSEESITFTYDILIELIDRAKTYLICERNAKAGDQVFLCPGRYYIPWLYACAELGLILIISASPKTKHHLLFDRLYGEIQHSIVPFNNELYSIYKEEHKNIIFDLNVIRTYDNTNCKNVFYATKDSVLTRSITEKLTFSSIQQNKNIKIASHTHQFYYDLAIRNKKILNLTKEDRCLHARILHHGSSLGVFFLPSMMTCDNHFWCNENTYRWVRQMAENRITKTMFYHTMPDQFIGRSSRKNWEFNNTTIYLLQLPSKEQIQELVEKRKINLSVVFGTTETSGPLFLQNITTKNYKDYNFRKFGQVLDDFYNISIDNGLLTIKMPDNTCVETKDNFSIINDDYYFMISI